MAVLAFLFVEEFQFILPIGLGFAAGAMIWIAIFELFPEALALISKAEAVVATSLAGCLMLASHVVIKDSIAA